MSAPAAFFELRAVCKDYGTQSILRDVNLPLREAEHTAMLGASGCGKSTVLRLLAGLETPTAGDVFIGGAHASSPGRVLIPPHHRRLAMVFQDLGLWPSQTVFENVLLGLDGCRWPPSERRSRVGAALELCRIEGLAQRLPGTLSGGEQQRVALARALAVDPALLLLDEPFAGLDLATKARLFGDLGELVVKRNLTVCLVTHDPTEAFTLCTHAVVLGEGGVLERGPWKDILCRPRSPLLQAFGKSHRPPALEPRS
jgi:putative spermidine/putrescine transport system ATP-binding protein